MDNVYTIDSKGRCRKPTPKMRAIQLASAAATAGPAALAGLAAAATANAAGATTLLGITIASAPAWLPIAAGATGAIAASAAIGYLLR